MKVDLLKKLIKEAVKEAVREELETILSEDAKPKATPVGVGGYGTPNTAAKYAEYRPTVAKPIKTGDPISDLLNETQYSMTSGEYHSHALDMRSMVDGGNYDEYMHNGHSQGPEPGLDLSQFDFIGKAGAIYRASQEKDKQRHGA